MNSGKSLPEKRGSYERAYASPGTRQPTRILVVDVTPPFWSDICTCLCEALENFFALACSLGGPPRLPLLSLYVVHNQQECLLPFVQVKGNFPRLHSCVTELRSMPKEGCLRQKPDSLKHAVEDGLLQFKQYMRHLTVGGSLNNCSVEFLSPLFLMAHAGASKRAWVPFPYASIYQLITILTSQPGNRVVKELESGLNETDMVSLRRLQVLQIYKCNPMELMNTESSTALSSEDNNPDECSILGTDIDLQKVENDTVSLECFFKGWLHNHGTDKEHLHLLLPAGRLANSTQRTCLKCDVQERLLSPALLPGMTDLVGKTEGLRDCQNPNKAASPGLLQHKLQVVKALKSDGVCESVFYGLPLVIRPTNCWKLDWDELETNHHNFHALCHTLENRGLMLLARSEPQVMGSNWTVHIDSYYILLPSSTLTLLVKSVAVRELVLPCEFPYRSEAPPGTALSKVQDILDGLDVEPTYNPLAVKSNLYKHLRGTLVRTPYRPQCKQVQRKDHHPPEHPKTQQHFKPYQSKMKATVAPLPMVRHSTNQAKSFRPALSMNSCSYNMSLLSDDDEFLADL